MYNFLEWEGQVWYYQAKFGVINSWIVQNVKDKKDLLWTMYSNWNKNLALLMSKSEAKFKLISKKDFKT